MHAVPFLMTPLSLGNETGWRSTQSIATLLSQHLNHKSPDNQPAVDIHVLRCSAQWQLITRLLDAPLTDIPAVPRGIPQIEVTFDIDKNGIVSVTKDRNSKECKTIVIQSNSGFTDEEIDCMMKDAGSQR